MKLHKIRLELVVVLIIGIILTYVLMVRPVIGVADNGDFPRIMNSVGLSYMSASYEERFFGYVNREYKIGIPIPFGGGYFSTELLTVAAAVALNRFLSTSGIFDIRQLGFLYSVVFIFSIFLIVMCVRKRWAFAGWLTAIFLIFIFADTAYTSYFNSLYGEAVTLVFLLLMIGAGLYLAFNEKPQLWILLVFFTGALFFAGAKVQNSPAGLFAVLLSFRLVRLRKDILWKRMVIALSIAVVTVSILSYVLVSSDIKVCNKYQTVFYGILKDSPDPPGDLAELGLDPAFEVLAGTNYFMAQYPLDIRASGFRSTINEKVSHLKIGLFYMKHFDRLVGKLEVAAFNGFKLSQGFGNYERSEGIEYKKTTSFFTFWSEFKMKVLPHSLFFIVLFFSASGFIIFFEYLRQKEKRDFMLLELCAFIWITGVLQFILPVIGDGEADLSKHLFLFNVCFDILFTGVSVYFLYYLGGLIKKIYTKFEQRT